MGVRSMHSVKAYARDILTWLRFLKERRGGKTVWQADREDVAAYQRQSQSRRATPRA
jgi:site-specific recombinase XerD